MRNRWPAVAALLVVIALVAAVNISRTHHRAAVTPPAITTKPTASAALSPPGEQVCSNSSAHAVTEDFGVTLGTPAALATRAVAARCSDLSGTRYPDDVRVVDDNDDGRILATLVRAAADWHIYALSASQPTATSAAVTVTASIKSGALYRQTFTTTDGTSFAAGPLVKINPVCAGASVQLSAVTAPGSAPGSGSGGAIIRITNTGKTSCVVEGYPTVAGVPMQGASSAGMAFLPLARSELAGHSGGVRSGNAPPVVLLSPGGVASASLDSSDQAPDGGASLCTSLTGVTVSVTARAPLGTVALHLRVCDFQAHPFVAGPTGSDS